MNNETVKFELPAENKCDAFEYDKKRILVDFFFDAQFCGSASRTVILPVNTTTEQIEDMFPEVLGLKYNDEHCWYKIYHLVERENLQEMYDSAMSFAALEQGGVDNWDWYSESFNDFMQSADQNADDWDDFIEKQFQESWCK